MTRTPETLVPGSGSLDGATHRFPVRVYYENTDAAGIVYHSEYLKFAERARTEWLRLMGVDHGDLREHHGIAFAVRGCTCDFRAPARLDDLLIVVTRLVAAGGASLELTQDVTRDGTVLVAMTFRLACMGLADGRAARLPRGLRHALRETLAAYPETPSSSSL